MIEAAAEVAALASAEKLGTADSYTIASTDVLTYLVTEQNVPADMIAPYQKQGITILQA